MYTTGWIKRGPVGLIGHTKGDALETIRHILDHQAAEKALGETEGRERVKIATREAMLAEARAHLTADANAGS